MQRLPRVVRVARGLALAVPLLTACTTVGSGPTAVPDAAPLVPVDAELAALARVSMYQDARLSAYLAGIVDRLATTPERETAAPAITVVVLEDPTIAVFTMPNAAIYVHSGLLAALSNEAELSAVLAREVTHVRRGLGAGVPADTTDRISAAITAIAPTIAAALARGDDARMLSPVAAVILGARLPHAYTAAMAGRGVEPERDADAGALERLVHAGYDPAEAPRAFDRLRRAAAEGGAAERFFVASEASAADRVATLTRLLTGMPSARAVSPPSVGERAEFDAAIIPLVRENARLEMRAGRFHAARAQLDRAIAADPADARARLYEGDFHRLRAQRARSMADRDELARMAFASYAECEALDPALAEVSRQIGLLYYQQGRHEQARAAFERYVARQPDAPDAARVAEYVLALTR
jgi:predicted Zn-dependent protease